MGVELIFQIAAIGILVFFFKQKTAYEIDM